MSSDELDAEPLKYAERCRSCSYPHAIDRDDRKDGCKGKFKSEDVAAAVKYAIFEKGVCTHNEKCKNRLGVKKSCLENHPHRITISASGLMKAFADVVDKDGDKR